MGKKRGDEKKELAAAGAKLRHYLQEHDLRSVRADVKEQVLAYMKAREQERWSRAEVAEELGLNERTLRRWAATIPDARNEPATPLFQNVALTESVLSDYGDGDERRIIITLPNGVRIEGVDIARIAYLLRKLT